MTIPPSPTEPQRALPIARQARIVYSCLTWLFALGVVLQVFFAGLGALVDPSYFGWHTSFARVLELLILLMLVAGAVGRVGWGNFGLTMLIFILFVLQYTFIYNAQGPARALHVVNALGLFWLTVHLGQRSWQLRRASRTASSTRKPPSQARRGEMSLGRLLLGTILILLGTVILLDIIFGRLPRWVDINAPAPSPESTLSPAAPGEEATAVGAQLFAQYCASCHGRNGEGGFGPALTGDERFEDSSLVVRPILHGIGRMPAFGNRLSDEEIAALATHIRTSWGNDFGDVTADEVRAQR
jgi:mono/diheme cytochrome c family protein